MVFKQKILKNLVDSGRYVSQQQHSYRPNEVPFTIKQTVLPFKLEETKDLITAHAGLALLGEFAVGLCLLNALDKDLPTPGSGAGYHASEHVFPLTLMLNGGGRRLEDLRQIRDDNGLREVLPLRRMPSTYSPGYNPVELFWKWIKPKVYGFSAVGFQIVFRA